MIPELILCYHPVDMKLQAVILTGTRDAHNPLLAGTALQSKVLLPVGGKPMVLSVLDALSASRFGPEVYVSSNDPEVLSVQTDLPFKSIPSEQKAVASVLKSLERLPGQEWVLFISGDHPLLTTEMIDHFIAEVLKRDLSFAVAAVNRNLVSQHYPESRRTWFPVKDGAYSGGNMFMVNKRNFQGRASFMETIDRNRKRPWKSMFMMDPLTILKIVFRQLTIHEIACRASRVFGCNVGVVDMPFSECCMDVDKPSDQALAEVILRRRQSVVALSDAGLSTQLQNASGWGA
ncbi:MAG TPA: nucleotidyltransferase family protein [Coleofasciculaceae cyanobacterium]|jgi:GTP:adenosylcobinamide-phosphate guanylyltransferase